jgi:hypothetical protein
VISILPIFLNKSGILKKSNSTKSKKPDSTIEEWEQKIIQTTMMNKPISIYGVFYIKIGE